MGKLNNKNAIVTGGGSGIGEAIAKLFAAEGADVLILDMNVQKANQVAEEIMNAGGKARILSCDVSDQKILSEQLLDSVGQKAIHILVNNAGVAHIGTATSTNEADFDRVMRINVKGYYNMCHVCLPNMVETGGGVIVNIASVAGSVGIKDRFAYSISKAAVIGMTLSIAKDFLPHNIRCNSISPARIHTPFVDKFLSDNYAGREKEVFSELEKTQPIGRMGTPAEVAKLALYLASDDASFLTGCDYLIDGGFVKLNT